MARIFISHRPGDAAGYVVALQEALAARYGREQVRTFAHVAKSNPGAPVGRLVEQAIAEADVVLAVIGTSWLTTTDEAGRTLADPDDRIRRELEIALAGGVTVMPVPMGGAGIPARESLPESLRSLPDRQAGKVIETSAGLDVERLVSDIDTVTGQAEAARRAEEDAARQPEPVQQPVRTPPRLEDWEMLQTLSTLASLGRKPREGVSERTKTMRNWFALLGMAAGAGAGWYATSRDDVDSTWLAVFIGLLVFNFISRALADVLSEPKKLRRLFYFALTPALASLSFYYTYQWWETWWLSFLLGFVFGGTLTSVVGSVLVPAIHREETADTRGRWKLST